MIKSAVISFKMFHFLVSIWIDLNMKAIAIITVLCVAIFAVTGSEKPDWEKKLDADGKKIDKYICEKKQLPEEEIKAANECLKHLPDGFLPILAECMKEIINAPSASLSNDIIPAYCEKNKVLIY